MFKGLSDFLVGLAGLILICVTIVFLVRGLDWVIEKTLPLNAIGIPPLIFSIVALCGFVLFVVWVSERPTRKLVREEKKRAELDKQIVMPLRWEILHNENKEARFHAASALGEIGSRQAVEVLCEALANGNGDLRTHVFNILVGLGDATVWELGLMLYGGGAERNKDSQFYAASALEKIGSPKAVKELCEELTRIDSNGDSRTCANHALVRIGSPAVEGLCLMLNKTDCIRAYAAIALGEIGDARAIEPLRKRLRRIDNPIQEFMSWAFVERINLGYGVRRTTWEWETDSLRRALVKCGWPTTLTGSSTVQNSTLVKNTMKRKIIIIALAVFIFTCLFPPWLNVLDVPYHAHQRTPAGNKFILSPPDSKGGAWSVEIDLKMLFVEWSALAAITGVVWLVVVKPAWSRVEKAGNPHKFIPPPGNPEN
jgi:PBS lyase HEAT-like repeat